MPAAALAPRFAADLAALTGPGGRVGVAVSGGPDSLALLLLAVAARPGAVEAATVDHGLRPESADEAAFVAGICAGLGVPHATLRPDAPITGNLQSAARHVRYKLLESWRAARGLDWLLTAHHADDQAETVLMRLNRGSGVTGLAGVRAVNGRVARPLLGWRRAELAGIVADEGIAAVADPGNVDSRYDRARLRAALAGADWLDVPAFARSAAALAAAEDALDWAATRSWHERVRSDGDRFLLDPAGLPAELVRRLVLRILETLAPGAAPRGAETSRLIARLEAGGTATLAGVKATGGALWRFVPAPPRSAIAGSEPAP
jgi:tRNA(Ile)-lysidine synthase